MLDDNKRIQQTKVLVKFHVNMEATSKNRIITKTLGKIGVISSDYDGVAPNDEEFWLCSVAKEVTKGTPVSGLFVLLPIRKVDREHISYLIHGMYTYEDEGGIRYVIPKRKNIYWLMSIDDRRAIMDKAIHAIVIVNYDCEMPGFTNDNPVQSLIPAQIHTLSDDDLDTELGNS